MARPLPPNLTTMRQVIRALGGYEGVQKLTGIRYRSAIANWLVDRQFPAKFYKVMQDGLRERGYSAPHRLWGQLGRHGVNKIAA